MTAPGGVHGAGILFVCTGNLCRSPVAERLTMAWLTARPGAAASGPHVASAGTAAVDGRPMHPDSARALSALGGDPGGFGSTRLTARQLDDADLILTATRDHRAQVLARRPDLMRRTFTLPEAAALVGLADPPDVAPLMTSERTRRLATALDGARNRRTGGPEDDIPDPIDQPAEMHAEVAEQIARALYAILPFVGPASPAARPGARSE